MIRQAMLAKIGAPDIDALFRDVPKEAVVPLSSFDLPDTKGELEVERILSKLAARIWRRARVPFFCGAGAYQASCAQRGGSSDPAFGIPHLLHALSAGNRARHAAISVRIPDPGGDAHRHGGGQCLAL